MKILVFGSLNIDHVYTVKRFVKPGETMATKDYARFCGGKGFNQAIALARSGQEVYLAGLLGTDAQMLRSALASDNVRTDYLKPVDAPNGHAIIQVDESGQNCIIVYGGTNRMVSQQDIDQVLCHFHQGDWLILQNEISNLPYLVRRGQEIGMRIVLNPSPMDTGISEEILRAADYLILNETEGCEITGMESPAEILPELKRRNPDITVVLTLGQLGAVGFSASGQPVYQPAYLLNCVDSTAAGDTFTGYFLAETIAGRDIGAAMQIAAVASGISVTRRGASASMPTRAEVEEEMKKPDIPAPSHLSPADLRRITAGLSNDGKRQENKAGD